MGCAGRLSAGPVDMSVECAMSLIFALLQFFCFVLMLLWIMLYNHLFVLFVFVIIALKESILK